MFHCVRCGSKEATVHLLQKVNEKETANVQLCAACAHPIMARQEAGRQGPTKCELCEAVAFSPLPGLRKITYACCGCRRRYSDLFFRLCETERPELVERSERDIFFFDRCFNVEIEHWADMTGRRALESLQQE